MPYKKFFFLAQTFPCIFVCLALYYRVRAAFFDHTVRVALFPPRTLWALGSATLEHARGRDSRALLCNSQNKRHIRTTHLGKSARVPTWPDSQTTTYSIFRSESHILWTTNTTLLEYIHFFRRFGMFFRSTSIFFWTAGNIQYFSVNTTFLLSGSMFSESLPNAVKEPVYY